ncbi:MAG: ion channel [Woeseiaceae bacterium]
MLITQLAIGSVIVLSTALFHVIALVFLAQWLRQVFGYHNGSLKPTSKVLLLGLCVTAILAIHTIEAWLWAFIYLTLGEFDSLTQALYFSSVTATTLGYGDIILSEQWQLLGVFEAMGGLILFGASTAFMLSLMRSVFDHFD